MLFGLLFSLIPSIDKRYPLRPVYDYLVILYLHPKKCWQSTKYSKLSIHFGHIFYFSTKATHIFSKYLFIQFD